MVIRNSHFTINLTKHTGIARTLNICVSEFIIVQSIYQNDISKDNDFVNASSGSYRLQSITGKRKKIKWVREKEKKKLHHS